MLTFLLNFVNPYPQENKVFIEWFHGHFHMIFVILGVNAPILANLRSGNQLNLLYTIPFNAHT